MIQRTVTSRSLWANRRFDSKYFLSPGTHAADRVITAKAAGVPTIALGSSESFASVWAPARFKRAYAAPGEDATPYLRPYDVLDYVPQAADWLSNNRSPNLASLRVSTDMLLQTCSGRNLGPAVGVDEHLASFAISHDMVRIVVDDPTERAYLLAFLNTPTGQALLRRDKTGSVIDHISVGHVAELEVPLFDAAARKSIAALVEESCSTMASARATISGAIDALERSMPPVDRNDGLAGGWTVTSAQLARLDAAYYDPLVSQVSGTLRQQGGVTLGDVADIVKPAGRYKTYYVESEFGRPLLSGRQILQHAPVNLQYISTRSLDEPGRYELRAPWTVFQADGRAEERLGFPAMVTRARDGWLASGHVGRLIPRDGVDPGWLCAAIATRQVQVQIKALACGSVVDALYPTDLAKVTLPAPGAIDGPSVTDAWTSFGRSRALLLEAVDAVEAELARAVGDETP